MSRNNDMNRVLNHYGQRIRDKGPEQLAIQRDVICAFSDTIMRAYDTDPKRTFDEVAFSRDSYTALITTPTAKWIITITNKRVWDAEKGIPIMESKHSDITSLFTYFFPCIHKRRGYIAHLGNEWMVTEIGVSTDNTHEWHTARGSEGMRKRPLRILPSTDLGSIVFLEPNTA